MILLLCTGTDDASERAWHCATHDTAKGRIRGAHYSAGFVLEEWERESTFV